MLDPIIMQDGFNLKYQLILIEKIGTIQDFKSIRFLRLFFNNFQDDVICRFASMELVRGEWRRYNNIT